MKVKIKKLNANAKMPTKAHNSDACYDLYCSEVTVDWAYNELTCKTGLAFEIPEGYAGYVYPRSSVTKYPIILHNCVGIIDSGFRGDVTVKFTITDMRRFLSEEGAYQVGDRIAQILIAPAPLTEFEWADNLDDSDRGEGGYGSTGK